MKKTLIFTIFNSQFKKYRTESKKYQKIICPKKKKLILSQFPNSLIQQKKTLINKVLLNLKVNRLENEFKNYKEKLQVEQKPTKDHSEKIFLKPEQLKQFAFQEIQKG